ncbi:MAG: enoyl-CoA hydratase/isomerase family protein [Deltaproteobacteria bacterium]|nr:enoyl-CoA hydratase/isomerase family protein [Deltaproteobacteria bacterium]
MIEAVKLEIDGPVALLTLKVPPINALDERALHELAAAIDEVEENPNIRSIIIASGIVGVFCTGGDLKFWPQAYPQDATAVSATGRNAFKRIERLTRPSLAAIQGRVIGDGLSLALACDIRFASSDASFRLPELDYGFIPGWGTIGRLVDVIGRANASEMLLLGEEIDAGRAQTIGLINRVFPVEDLMSSAKACAAGLASKPPVAIRSAKAALRGNEDDRSQTRTDLEIGCFQQVWGGREWREGIGRLFQKSIGPMGQ